MLIYCKSSGVTYPALCHTLILWIVKEKYVFQFAVMSLKQSQQPGLTSQLLSFLPTDGIIVILF